MLRILLIVLLCLPAPEAFARAAPLRDRGPETYNPVRRQADSEKIEQGKAVPLRTPIQEPALPAPVIAEPTDTPEPAPQASVPPAPLKEEDLIESPIAQESSVPVIAMGSAYKEKGLRIALLLPLSGKSAPAGRAILNAAEMALFETKSDNSLLPFDTKGTDEGALAAAGNALAAHVDVVLGPLTDAEAPIINERLKNTNLPIVTFAHKAALAKDGFLVFGISPAAGVRRVADYAVKNGIETFSALVPENAAGTHIADEIKKYKTNKIEKISYLDYKNSEALQNLLMQPEGTKPSPKLHSEGLLIAESGDALVKLTAKLMENPDAPNRFQLLGLSTWDDPKLLKHKPLVGAWFAVSPPELRFAFETRYKEKFGTDAPRIASLGYDAIALLAALSQDGKHPGRSDFLNPVGFSGINGAFRFNMDGIAERLLGVAEITEEGFVIVDPVPEGF